MYQPSHLINNECEIIVDFKMHSQALAFLQLVPIFNNISSVTLCQSRILHQYGDVTIVDEGLHILTHARHSWPLSSEGCLECRTYCDTGHTLIFMVISEDR